MINVIDKFYEVVNPQKALDREAARLKLGMTRQINPLNSGYDGSGASRTKKSMLGWRADSRSAFEDIEMNPIPQECEANYWLSCLTLKEGSKVKPLDIMVALENENIESRPIWKPMHLQPVFEGSDFITSETQKSVSEDIFDRGVCLPSDIKMTEEDIKKVIQIIRALF